MGWVAGPPPCATSSSVGRLPSPRWQQAPTAPHESSGKPSESEMTTAESQRASDAGVPGVEDPVDPRPAVRDLPARGRCVLVAQGRGGRRQVQANQLELHAEDVRVAV